MIVSRALQLVRRRVSKQLVSAKTLCGIGCECVSVIEGTFCAQCVIVNFVGWGPCDNVVNITPHDADSSNLRASYTCSVTVI